MSKECRNCVPLARLAFLITVFALLLVTFAAYAAEAPYDLEWARQIGTASDDVSYSVAVDGLGNAYIGGYTKGSLGGPNTGYTTDAFLAKYDSSGTLLWTRQIGTTVYDYGQSVAVDGLGNAYISGKTGGSLGGPNAGGDDAFLAKYDSSGTLLWTRQIGTMSFDWSYSVAVDGLGNASCISGTTSGSLGGPNAGGQDAFLAKYDSSGALLWTRQIGTTSSDFSYSVAADGLGNAYISGYTWGSLGGPNAGSYDMFLAKYDSSGALLWTRQMGTAASDYSRSVAVDGLGNAYISGKTGGSLGGLNAGGDDAFLAKYDSSGALLWTRQIGSADDDYSYSVAVDGLGNAYISGGTQGNLGGPNAGKYDAFLAKYNSSGALLWSRQIGSADDDYSYSVAVDGLGTAYISGATSGSLGGPNAGKYDAFLAKFSVPTATAVVPEPGTVFMIASAVFSLAAMAARLRRTALGK